MTNQLVSIETDPLAATPGPGFTVPVDIPLGDFYGGCCCSECPQVLCVACPNGHGPKTLYFSWDYSDPNAVYGPVINWTGIPVSPSVPHGGVGIDLQGVSGGVVLESTGSCVWEGVIASNDSAYMINEGNLYVKFYYDGAASKWRVFMDYFLPWSWPPTVTLADYTPSGYGVTYTITDPFNCCDRGGTKKWNMTETTPPAAPAVILSSWRDPISGFFVTITPDSMTADSCGCFCPQTPCSKCTNGTGPRSPTFLFNADVVWTFISGQRIAFSKDISSLAIYTVGAPTGADCEWTAHRPLTTYDVPPGGGYTHRYIRFYYDTASSSYQFDIDFWKSSITYAPTTFRVKYRLASFDCCASNKYYDNTNFFDYSQEVTITRVSGPTGGNVIYSEPTTVKIKTCGGCLGVAGGMGTAADQLISQLLSIAAGKESKELNRPYKCEFLLKRTEFRSGCSGMTCRHDCKLNLPAVPADYCQTCTAYVKDEDNLPWLS
jgi:hypothetical protein